MKKIEIDDTLLKQLHDDGLSNAKIAMKFKCNTETVRLRKKVLGLGSNQGITINGIHRKQTSIKKEILELLVLQELSDYKIAAQIGKSPKTVEDARKFYGLSRGSLLYAKPVGYTQRQLEILIGHVLGDGNLSRVHTNTQGTISQGVAQLEYAKWKAKELHPLCGPIKINTRKTADKRTGLYYTSADAHIKANPELNWLYDMLYCKGYKELNPSLVMCVTPLSLAVWFMDDGYLASNGGYCIATHCFKQKQVIRDIFAKFGIKVTIHKTGATYIHTSSAQKFANLIQPYLHSTLRYKLHPSHVTPLIQGKP